MHVKEVGTAGQPQRELLGAALEGRRGESCRYFGEGPPWAELLVCSRNSQETSAAGEQGAGELASWACWPLKGPWLLLRLRWEPVEEVGLAEAVQLASHSFLLPPSLPSLFFLFLPSLLSFLSPPFLPPSLSLSLCLFRAASSEVPRLGAEPEQQPPA